ncbi:hypothetical protein FHU33_1578 [Blastococcus colisei]|uniref:Uncharacterized protein n=1 Tax=Blastococcus colisei TaxID=1564162 RepID=A0A543PDL5_9ACTN|nr:hypothetical protein [Blastococcus colisei]TQN42184.1 hypothetical protein FHU33_1578 [Blastococcus colisei]
MTARRAAAVALAGFLVLTLSGCPVDGAELPRPSATAEPRPDLPTDATTDLPAYGGPPAGALPSAGPLTRVRATVDLTAATPGRFARLVSAVATPDGGAYALLTPSDREVDQSLAIVRADAIAGTVPLPRVEDVWGMHLLPDGSVAVAGRLGAEGYGVRVVDPSSGIVRSTVVVPDGGGEAVGGSALLAGSTTLYLFVSLSDDESSRELLSAVDLASGQVTAQRDLADDVAAASHFPVARQFAGLVARPGGGVRLVFDASPTAVAEERIPTLLTYDAGLAQIGRPVRATDLAEGAETQSVAGGADGTAFLLVAVLEGSWILGVPDGGGAGPLLAQLEDRIYGYSLVVEPAQVWAVLPSASGARALDLTTGEMRGPVAVGCEPRLDVRALYPAPGGALMIGECDTPREDTQLLWFLTP